MAGVFVGVNVATDQGGPAGGLAIVHNRPLLTLTLGHFTVDMYAGLFPVLYPLLIERFVLDLKTVGLVSLAYTGLASLSQPFFGWIADRYGTRFIGLALVWTAVTFATIGFAPTFPILVLLAGAAGIGSGAYHPLGAVNANAVIPPAGRNRAMSAYVTGGTIGVALGLLIGAVLFSAFGVRGTALMVLPGATIALWLLVELRRIALRRPAAGAGMEARPAPIPVGPLAATIGVMMARSWTVFSIQAFVPTWYRALGYGESFYGPLTTTIVLASALGTLGCGALADRWGWRAVVIGSMVLSVPAILLFAQFTGPVAFVSAALVGALAASTAPLMLVTAQQLMRGRAGLASGLVLGLGFVMGAIGVPVTGAVADAWGLPNAVRLQALITAGAIAIAWFLPREEELRRIAAAPPATTSHPALDRRPWRRRSA